MAAMAGTRPWAVGMEAANREDLQRVMEFVNIISTSMNEAKLEIQEAKSTIQKVEQDLRQELQVTSQATRQDMASTVSGTLNDMGVLRSNTEAAFVGNRHQIEALT